MKRILFVDDEPNVLMGLRNSLRSRRTEWECIFALGPDEAIEHLRTSTFDVVVSDMRMPKRDGTAVLSAAKELQPKAVRMILSGQTELESAMKSVFVAHVFLAKPCDTDTLQKAVARSCNLVEFLDHDDLKARLGAVGMLPPAPRTYLELNRLLAIPDVELAAVAAVIERDLALAAKVIQIVNSAFFGLPRKIGSVLEAVSYLGTNTMRNLALALETFSEKSSQSLPAAELDELARISLRAGHIAFVLAGKDKRKADEAFLAGLLHAVGKLLPVPASQPGGAESPGWPVLGAYLLGLWGLPHSVIEAIAYHQNPASLPHDTIELVDLLHLAHHLAKDAEFADPLEHVDRKHLLSVGFSEPQLMEAGCQFRALKDGKEATKP